MNNTLIAIFKNNWLRVLGAGLSVGASIIAGINADNAQKAMEQRLRKDIKEEVIRELGNNKAIVIEEL